MSSAPAWYNGNDEDLMTLRKTLDLFDPEEINKVLIAYTQTMELMIAQEYSMDVAARIDWSIANSLSPDWFGDHLTTRIQNSMLVSALLLTVTATSFLSPVGINNEFRIFRATGYLNAICSAMFLASIFLGICFIENAMSRAYCWSDRFVLIIKYYLVKDIAQISAAAGTIIFPLTLVVPMQETYLKTDSIAIYILYGLYGAAVVYYQIRSMKSAAAKQNIRTIRFKEITDHTTGRLLPRFAPPTAGSLEDFEKSEDKKPENIAAVYEAMYNMEGNKLKDSVFGCIKL